MWPRVEPFACGQVRCAALIRMFWPEAAFSITAIGKMAGSSFTHVIRIADRMGLGPRPNARPKVSLSAAAVRKNYLRRDMTVHQIAAMLGCNTRTLQIRARKLGLPPRKDGRLQDIVSWPDDFEELWLSGIRVREILRACARPPKSDAQVSTRAKRLGLPMRGSGSNENSMTLEEAREQIAARKRKEAAAAAERAIAVALAQSARAEREAWKRRWGKGCDAYQPETT